MAFAKSVIVLAPNGRRQTVNVTPDTTVLQVLEEVCKKQGFPAEEYDIKHHNHVVDPTSVIRFSGLPNNAQLEMARAFKQRIESEVCVGVQLESGSRFTGSFMPGDSIWDVIQKLCPEEAKASSNPVVIYMRSEIAGVTKLKGTTLRMLGITAGRAMVRLIHRTPEELQHQANVSAPLQRRPVETVEKQVLPTNYTLSDKQKIGECSSSTPVSSKRDVTVPKTNITQEDSRSETKTSTLNAEQQHFNQTISDSAHANNQDKDALKANEVKKSGEKPVTSAAKVSCDAGHKTGMEGRVTSVRRPQVHQVQETSVEEILFLGERNAIAYNMAAAHAAIFDDLPDDFFELTVEDARVLLRDIKKQREQMEDAPITTAAMRELEKSKQALNNLNRYKKTVIRIQFPDQMVLQGTFTPVETVFTVHQFIRNFLQDPIMPFYLFTAPPKNVLSEEEHLVEAGLVPSAVVYFGSELTPSEGLTYLKSDILDRLTSPSAAALAACQHRGLPQETEGSRSSSSEQRAGPSGYQQQHKEDSVPKHNNRTAASSPETRPSKVPKWFKPIK